MNENRPRILLCCSGSVATVKIPEIVNSLYSFSEIRILYTSSAPLHFLARASTYNPENWKKFVRNGGMNMFISDYDEWDLWNKIGDPVLHIELRRWADIILFAPASADIMAKITAGICDSLVLSVIRAWDSNHKPCIICPAMNTAMWEHPSTEEALKTLQKWGWIIVQPAEKLLACNDKGKGALASVTDIITIVQHTINTSLKESSSSNSNSYIPKNVPMLYPQWPNSSMLRYRYHAWRHFICYKHRYMVVSVTLLILSLPVFRENLHLISI